VFHAAVSAAFENVHEAHDVAVDVGVGIQQGVAHAGLGGKMHHAIEILLGEQRRHAGAICHVHLDEAEVFRRQQPGQTIALEFRAVVVVEVVQADHSIASRQQQLRNMHAYEASRARDQDFHLLQARSACESKRRGLSASPTNSIRVKHHIAAHCALRIAHCGADSGVNGPLRYGAERDATPRSE
jgi:hypothetical protein